MGLPGQLGHGKHTASVELRTILGKTAARIWEFEVDRKAPTLNIEAPVQGELTNKKLYPVSGSSEPNSILQVGEQKLQVESNGRFSAEVELEQGENTLNFSTVDSAGNVSKVELKVTLDSVPPKLSVKSPIKVVREAKPVLKAVVQEDRELADCTLVVDKKSSHALKPDKGGNLFFELGDLPEGKRSLELVIHDAAGNEVSKSWNVILDTTESFGKKVTTEGAIGKDVKVLQRRLAALRFLDASKVSGNFGPETREALEKCQKHYNLKPDGVVGPDVVAVLGPRIHVNLKKFELALEELGGKVIRYGIAHGLPEHPTPTGKFYIAEKIADPTWIPPDSAWAKEAEVTPPGAENPLGTRWLGLNTGLVGIHGTPYSWSIGSQASHGCIRMRTTEVEKLYELVGVGTEVTIWKGDEKEEAIKRLWP